jgi:hypothetical protein
MKPNKLLVIAHPDDETLFFGGLLLRHQNQFKVILVTDANADQRKNERMLEFQKALELLGVKHYAMLDFPDIYSQRIDLDALEKILVAENANNYEQVFTHNIIGEYGHPHHQDISYVVHKVFKTNVYSTAYNSYPDLTINLTGPEFNIKSQILCHIYGKETQRFLNMLPITFSEGFHHTEWQEIESIYQFLTQDKSLQSLKKYSHLKDYLESIKKMPRPF